MPFDFQRWMDKYEKYNPNETIDYKDSSNSWQTETDYRLSNISQEFSQRGYITKPELTEIGKWKVPTGRIDHHLKKNNPTYVEQCSKIAFQASATTDSVDALMELTGVRVPVASAILTMMDPSKFAVIDFRAMRALGAVDQQLLDPQQYDRYIDYLDSYREYREEPGAYEFYIDQVQQIARHEGILPREVDMALWAYDNYHS